MTRAYLDDRLSVLAETVQLLADIEQVAARYGWSAELTDYRDRTTRTYNRVLGQVQQAAATGGASVH